MAMARLRVIGFLLGFCLLGWAAPALAQSGNPPPSPAKVQLLLDLLSDPEVRNWLQQQNLEKARGAEDEDATQLLQSWLEAVRSSTAKLPQAVAELPLDSIAGVAKFFNRTPLHELWLAPLAFALALGLAAGAEWLFWRLTRRFRHRLIDAAQRDLGDRLRVLATRIVSAALALALFILVAMATFLVFGWSRSVESLGGVILLAIAAWRLATLAARILFSPRNPRLRLVPLDDRAAQLIYHGITVLAGVKVFTAAAAGWLGAEKLLGRVGLAGFNALAGLAVLIAALAVIWISRREILRSHQDAHLPRPSFLMIDLWPFFATVLLPVIWMLENSGATPLADSFAILLWVPLLIVAVRLILKKLILAPPELLPGEEAPVEPATQRSYPVALDRFLRALIILGGIFAIAAEWQVDPLSLAESDNLAARIVNGLFLAVVTLLIADFVWQMIKAAIDRRIPEIVISDIDSPGDAAQATRLQTLLPLLRNFIMILVWLMAGLICLSTLGVNVGPLLAGAGIAGIAIGFGTQALVRDVIAGVFFLVDDAFRIGEYIESGDIRGTVEGFSLRSVRLRHHRGYLHTVPFGDLKAITNYSRDWVVEKLEFSITYDTDLELVRKVIKKVGQEMLADPEFGKVILEPLKSQGVLSMGEYGINIRAKVKTKPGEQFIVRREAYRRVKQAFDEAGIKFAVPTVSVQGGGGDAAAAQAALLKSQAAKA